MQKLDTSKTSWNLSLIFSNEADFEAEKQRVTSENYKFINKWKGRSDYLTDASVLKQALDELEQIEATVGTTGALSYYYGLKLALDQTNPQILSKLNKIEEFAVKIANDM